jgi:LAGLIDADG-like domain
MYAPSLVAQHEAQLLTRPAFRALFPDGLPHYSIDDSRSLAAQIEHARDERGEPTRRWTPEEQRFVGATQLRVMFDARYFLEAFYQIDLDGRGLRYLYPLWESQTWVLDRLGDLELQHLKDRSPDGLLVNILKVRQVGITTLGVALVTHRLLTQPHIRALLGADVESQAGYMFKMAERAFNNLPSFLKPARTGYNKDREMLFSNASSVRTAWGKTTRGALQDAGGTKGALERGRSQPVDEPVLTPFGWKRMGDIEAGDFVVGANGRPTRVLSVHPQGVEDVYRVTFMDGAWTECSLDHLWQVSTTYDHWRGRPPRVMSTRDLLERGLKCGPPHHQTKWFIPMTQPVEFPKRPLPLLSPYIIGVLIGDGCTRQGGGNISCRDQEIQDRVRREMPEGCRIVPHKLDWSIRGATSRYNPVTVAIAYLGLQGKYSYEKRIPHDYLMGSVADRIALLQGLMDTDGTANLRTKKVSFCTTSPELKDDFCFLVESLGGNARVNERPIKNAHFSRKTKHMIHSRRGSFVINIRLPWHIVPFHLSRKIAELMPVEERKYPPSRGIGSIELVGRKATQCLRVDAPDALYLTRHCVVTHNTHSVWHIGELATWDHPKQIDTAFLPGVPISPAVLGILESTAEVADDWWQRHWLTTKAGAGRFTNIFLPNYAVPGKYSLPPPPNWTPSDQTLNWVQKAERESPQWFGGKTIHPTKAQAYWYENTRSYFEQKRDLNGFLREYPSDDIECFQYAGIQIFSHDQHERLAAAAQTLKDVWAVEPSREIAELRRIQPIEDDPYRRPVPWSSRVPRQATIDQFPVPPGYGFRRLPPSELRAILNTDRGLKQSVLAIYEYPRLRGPRKYVMGVDVAYGTGHDYSVVTVVRTPTIEEPADEVAQYISNIVTPSQFAWVVDAIGHLYADEEQIEALAAIETNGPGISVQDTLQLHLGYSNFYTWEYLNARDPERRFATKMGWWTTPSTRPLLMTTFYEAVTNQDAISGRTDYRLNSTVTMTELRTLIVPRDQTIGEAEAAHGQNDDAIMSSAIGYYVAYRLAGGEAEPIADRRKRRDALVAYHATLGVSSPQRRDWRNSDIEADRIPTGVLDARDDDDDGSPLHFDPRTTE